jgi:hypothetical protein
VPVRVTYDRLVLLAVAAHERAYGRTPGRDALFRFMCRSEGWHPGQARKHISKAISNGLIDSSHGVRPAWAGWVADNTGAP